MKPLAFRVRIALLSALISGVVLVAFGANAWYLMYQERLEAMDREIRALAYRHPGWMGSRMNYERLSSVIEMIFGEERKEQLILLAAGADGSIRYQSPHWPKDLDPKTLDLRLEDNPGNALAAGEGRAISGEPGEGVPAFQKRSPWGEGKGMGRGAMQGSGRMRGGGSTPIVFSKTPRFQSVRTAQATWRLGILGDQNDRLVLGLNIADLQAELHRLRQAFLLVLPLALSAIGGGGWWIAGYAVRPLRSIAQVAEGVTARGLNHRIPASEEDPEVARLIRVLNSMMDRLELSFQQATRFSADASHELKTPLSIMQGELENALQAAAPGSAEQQVFANLLEETQRLKSITNSLLLLAQADAGQLPLRLERINLGAALEELTQDIETLAAETGVKVELRAAPAIWIEADPVLLQRAVLNLLQNGLRYNEPNGWITVELGSRNGRSELNICNGGPGISPADQKRLFNRFFRADAARSRIVHGMGLGLSLAREIARAHRGDLALQESRPGRTCFTLWLPVAGEAQGESK